MHWFRWIPSLPLQAQPMTERRSSKKRPPERFTNHSHQGPGRQHDLRTKTILRFSKADHESSISFWTTLWNRNLRKTQYSSDILYTQACFEKPWTKGPWREDAVQGWVERNMDLCWYMSVQVTWIYNIPTFVFNGFGYPACVSLQGR